jgi:hypothetical protein
MKLLIVTPTYEWEVLVPYLTSVIGLLDACRERGIEADLRPINTPLISRARNAAASLLLQDETYTHLLFIDSDMGFGPDLVPRMLAFGQPFVGLIYPYKAFDYPAVARTARSSSDAGAVRLASQVFVGEQGGGPSGDVHLDEQGRPDFRDGFFRMRRVGCGVLLLKREVITRLLEAYPQLWTDAGSPDYRNYGVTGGVFQPFESMADELGRYQGEDYAFCRRWSDLGGDIWACGDETITHMGRHGFTGNYLVKLRHARGG